MSRRGVDRPRGWDEARIHAWLARRPRPLVLDGSTGHDAAVLRPLDGRPVWCTDQVWMGVHLVESDGPRRLGAKAVARTLSDLAACGARPVGVLLALACPAHWTDARVRSAISGAAAAVEAHGGELLGGDLTSTAGPAGAVVSALGVLPGRRRPVGRDRARAGQVLLLTGPVGGSGLGRHRAPRPRLAAGRRLFEAGATALMDVSDGLWLDASRIAAASGVRITLEEPRIPVHRDARRAARTSGRSALEHALTDGEDHELLASLAPAVAERLLAEGLPGCPAARVIGRIEAGSGLRVVDAAGRPLARPSRTGWIHRGRDGAGR